MMWLKNCTNYFNRNYGEMFSPERNGLPGRSYPVCLGSERMGVATPIFINDSQFYVARIYHI